MGKQDRQDKVAATEQGAGSASASLEAQRQYTKKLRQEKFDFGIVVADAFVRGIREIGYKHTGTAIDELIDNSIQAGASRVDVLYGYAGKSDKKPTQIGVLDDAHGMERDMLRAAVIWGGTHRENDRSGFGRFGYGLPSASVSQGRRFTVYSKTDDSALHKLTLDLDEITEGKHREGARIVVPEAEPAELPEWVQEYMRDQFGSSDLEHGTLVLIEKLDRTNWSTAKGLNRNLLEHFGVTYRNFLRSTRLFVDGREVEPVDPLFITPGMRWYDVEGIMAEALAPMEIPVKDRSEGDDVGVINVRFSVMPPNFQRPDGKLHKGRLSVMKEHRGIVVSRAGRQIDVVDAKCPWYTFQNYDRNWGVEIDFPPVFDEEFNVTTSKQQVVLSDRMWDILKDAGVKAAIKDLKERFKRLRGLEKKKEEESGGERPSEKAMSESKKFKTRKASPTKEQEERSRENFEKEVQRRVEQTGLPESEVRKSLQLEVSGRTYRVGFEEHPGAPFFRVDQVGGQRRVFLNTAHRFFTDVYAGPDSSPRLRAAIEILLFVLGDAEIEAEGDRRTFYQSERMFWSQQLEVALDQLDRMDSVEDALAAEGAARDEAELEELAKARVEEQEEEAMEVAEG